MQLRACYEFQAYKHVAYKQLLSDKVICSPLNLALLKRLLVTMELWSGPIIAFSSRGKESSLSVVVSCCYVHNPPARCTSQSD
jgi:hypothetical protein